MAGNRGFVRPMPVTEEAYQKVRRPKLPDARSPIPEAPPLHHIFTLTPVIEETGGGDPKTCEAAAAATQEGSESSLASVRWASAAL